MSKEQPAAACSRTVPASSLLMLYNFFFTDVERERIRRARGDKTTTLPKWRAAHIRKRRKDKQYKRQRMNGPPVVVRCAPRVWWEEEEV